MTNQPEIPKRIENIKELHKRVDQGLAQAKAFMDELEKQGFDVSRDQLASAAGEKVPNTPLNYGRHDQVEYRAKFNGRVWSLISHKGGYGKKREERMRQLAKTGRTERQDHTPTGQWEILPREEKMKLYAQDKAAADAKRTAEEQQKAKTRLAETKRYYDQEPGAFRNWSTQDKIGRGLIDDVVIPDDWEPPVIDHTAAGLNYRVNKRMREGDIPEDKDAKPSQKAVEGWNNFWKQQGYPGGLNQTSVYQELEKRHGPAATRKTDAKGNLLLTWKNGPSVSIAPDGSTEALPASKPKKRKPGEKSPEDKPEQQSQWEKDDIARYLDSIEKSEGAVNRFQHALEFTLGEMEHGIPQGSWREALVATLQKAKPDERFKYFSEVQRILQRDPTGVWGISQVGDGDTFILSNKENNMAVRFEKVLSDPTVSLALAPNPAEREQFGLQRWNALLEDVPAVIKGEVEADFRDIKSNALRADLLTLLKHEQGWTTTEQPLEPGRVRWFIDSVRDSYIHASPNERRAVVALLQKRAIHALRGQLR